MKGLTKAQRRFMREIAGGMRYSNAVLRGGEISMAERLAAKGLLCLERDSRKHEWFWTLRDAGRQALQAEPQSPP
jgi:hypothetical protein